LGRSQNTHPAYCCHPSETRTRTVPRRLLTAWIALSIATTPSPLHPRCEPKWVPKGRLLGGGYGEGNFIVKSRGISSIEEGLSEAGNKKKPLNTGLKRVKRIIPFLGTHTLILLAAAASTSSCVILPACGTGRGKKTTTV